MPLPQDNAAVQAHYRDRQASLQIEQKVIVTRRLRLRIFLGLCLALALYSGKQSLPNWLLFTPLAVIVAAMPTYLGFQKQIDRILRLQVFHDTNLARVDGTKTHSGHTGDEFHTASHLYDRDLNILGPDSLFGLLATVRTGVGQRGLARILLEPTTSQQAIERQRCVQELAPLTTLREQILLLGPSRFQEIPASLFDSSLDDPPPTFHPMITWALVLTSITTISLLLAGLSHVISWPTMWQNFAAAFAVQAGIALSVRRKVLPILNASKVASQMQLFADGLALLDQQSFTSPRLRALQQIGREPSPAASIFKRIQSQFVIVEQRTKEWFYVLSLLLSAGTHAAIAIANWKRKYVPAMRQWLAAWAEFEALNALANYAFEHPEDAYPTLLPESEAEATPATFEATDLGHPLLPAHVCVRNDVSLNSATRFYLISGSNMAGKSTLLRAIGTNAVLAYAGAPVRATSLHLTPLTIGASLALTDSLAENKSKFLAEVERLHAILLASQQAPTLFLVDELFSGTNSHDRCTAAEAVLSSLLRHGAIGALSTHDLTLTALATPENHGVNVHMASPDPDDPLAFDFRLKPGVNPSSNALAIIRMMGIEA
jgi:MutS-like protein